MEQKKFYKFTERNSWEGETWHFFLLLIRKEWSKIAAAIKEFSQYTISEFETPKSEVDVLVKNSDVGYLAYYNKVSKVKLPAKINLEKNDIFYKGGCWKVDKIMICNTLDDAIKAAKGAKVDNLCGLYPSACIVLADEIKKLQDALTVIAFPHRGTHEETWSVDEIGKYAAQFIKRD